jgi:uncharacterized repeat protein (TIGR03803 family)
MGQQFFDTTGNRYVRELLFGALLSGSLICLLTPLKLWAQDGDLAAAAASSPSFKTLAYFNGANGYAPTSMSLIQGTDGNLYGSTEGGCSVGCGNIFKLSPGGGLATVYSFGYAEGAWPEGSMVQGSDGNFYGTTYGGGSSYCRGWADYGCGTVFKLTPAGKLTTLYAFCPNEDCSTGSNPSGPLIEGTDGDFYGTTTLGGTGNGTIFKIAATGKLTTLYTFASSDGAQPTGLIQGTDGNFYGTTMKGGSEDDGTAFVISSRGTLTTLHNFCTVSGFTPTWNPCIDGGRPEAPLVQGSDGNFYGTTSNNGLGGGTFFQLTTGGTLTTLHNFCSQTNCTDGASPAAPLIQATDGNFYGTTNAGGTNPGNGICSGCGTLFQITPSGKLTTLHDFAGTDGTRPNGLVQGTDGEFYGTTNYGGTVYTGGTAFSLNAGLGPFVVVRPASGAAGAVVTVLGTDLADAKAVSFNGTKAKFTVVSGTEITSTVPAGATPGPVQVTTSRGVLHSNVNFMVRDFACPKPVFSPVGGSYSAPRSVSIADATTDCAVWYRINGGAWTAYQSKIPVDKTETIAAYSRYSSGYGTSESSVVRETYIIVGPPTVTNEAARSIASTSAILGATANDNGMTATAYFVYGTSATALTSSTTKQTLPPGTTAQSITASITGLASKTTYYFRAVASNAKGTGKGAVVSFETE